MWKGLEMLANHLKQKAKTRSVELAKKYGNTIMLCLIKTAQPLWVQEISKRVKLSDTWIYWIIEHILLPTGMVSENKENLVIGEHNVTKRSFSSTELGWIITKYWNTTEIEKEILRIVFLHPDGIMASEIEKQFPTNTIPVNTSIYELLDWLTSVGLIDKKWSTYHIKQNFYKAIIAFA